MIICQVDAGFSAMGKEDIEQELKAVEEVFAVMGGELVHADVSMGHGCLVAYVRAESELVVSDIFDASHFTVGSITYLKPSHEACINLPKFLSWQDGQWVGGSELPVLASACQPPQLPKTPARLDFRADRPPSKQGSCPQPPAKALGNLVGTSTL